jgi:hypothetical protein
MRRLFAPLVLVLMVLFSYAPVYIASAPFESTMGLVQKIFYFHVPAWFAMFTSVCSGTHASPPRCCSR